MTLAVETTGAGPDLVLLHGWGLHGGFFAPLLPHLEPHFRVHRVDLPGHGRSASTISRSETTLETWTDAVRASVPEKAIWLGWSLGGLIALHAAMHTPEIFDRLVLVASTPRFTTAPDWPHAQSPEMLERFATDLRGDFRGTVEAFLTLQSLGDARAREHIRALRPLLFEHGDPDPAGLAAGLDILRDTDLRAGLADVQVPAWLIAGQRDRLTPPQAMAAMSERLGDAALEVRKGAAHAPFLSDPAAFARGLSEFAHGR